MKRPYAQFKFLVDLGAGSAGVADAGFHECSRRGREVTLRRGATGLPLNQWIDQIRNVVVRVQNDDHTGVVQTWKLLRARIIKHTGGPLNAKGADVAVEELVLACERLEIE